MTVKSIFFTPFHGFGFHFVPGLGVSGMLECDGGAVDPQVMLRENFCGVAKVVVDDLQKLGGGVVFLKGILEEIKNLGKDR